MNHSIHISKSNIIATVLILAGLAVFILEVLT
jgi:hypothetical protein